MKSSYKNAIRKSLIFLIPFALLLVLLMPMIVNPIRNPWFVTRGYVLRITPIGTHIDDVVDVINDTENWRIFSSSNDQGFRRTSLNGQTVMVGEKFIRVNVSRGDSANHTTMSAFIYWGFDDNGKLLDVHVRRVITS